MAHGHHARTLPADLGAPAFVKGWRSRALIVGAVFSVLSILLALLDKSVDHLLRAWLLGFMICFGFCRRRHGRADGAVSDRWQVGPAGSATA